MTPGVFLFHQAEKLLGTAVGGPLMRLFERLREIRFRLVKQKRRYPVDPALEARFCPKPFIDVAVQENGSMFLCCPPWLPTRAGSITGSNARKVWNSKRARAIRRSIHDGNFQYCNKTLCPSILAGTLPTKEEARQDPFLRDIIDKRKTTVGGIPRFINMSHDRSCNLSCPSCRTQKISYAKGPAYDRRKALHDAFMGEFLSEPSDQEFCVSVTGTGDAFGSRIFREFLHELDGSRFPNMRVNIQTNGVMFTPKEWHLIQGIHDNLGAVLVSFDAASEATYNITRRGGHWGQLLRNMDHLGEMRRQGKLKHLRVDYVVQDVNFREMADFVALGKRFHADVIYFSRADFWGTWSLGEFKAKCVWEPGHPDHDAFNEMIARPVFDDPQVDLGNLTPYREAALKARGEAPERAAA